jgi:hypothetical protein
VNWQACALNHANRNSRIRKSSFVFRETHDAAWIGEPAEPTSA